MSKNNIFEFKDRDVFSAAWIDLLRTGAQQVIP